MRTLCGPTLGILLSVACGSSDPAPVVFETFDEACSAVEGCGAERGATSESIWRVAVVRETDGTYRIMEIDRVDVPEDGVPFGPFGGDVAVVGRDASGANVDGQLLAFADVMSFEGSLDGGGRVEVPLEGPVRTTAYVRALADVETLAVIDSAGVVFSEAAIPAAIVFGDEEIGSRSDALIRASASCPHILLFDQGELQFGDGDVMQIEAPGPTQQAVVDAAFGYATYAVCNSVGRIAFVNLPDRPGLGGQVHTSVAGDLILINTARMAGLANVYSEEFLANNAEWRLRLMRTILHEAAHVSESLFNEVSDFSGGDDGQWLRSSRGLAAITMERTRLRQGLQREWQRLHDGFVSVGWAEVYPPSVEAARGVQDLYDAEQAARAGAMSRYGTTSLADDIAELVSWATLGAQYEAAGIPMGRNEREDYACQAMATYVGAGVPSRYSAVYSKLRFLQDLGLVHERDVERCIGPVRLIDAQEGLRLYSEDSAGQMFASEVSGQIGTLAGRYVFEMSAGGSASFSGMDYPATVRFRLDLGEPETTEVRLVSWPRGVYRILPGTGNDFSLRLMGAAAGDFDVTDGYAYVAESSNELIEGSFFITQAFRASAPVPVPQVFDPPLNVRFRLVN
ncbi:MAG: hypothetical protein ACI9KE_001870 [Polyangiales bacterium]|jgi:hypothetical protein